MRLRHLAALAGGPVSLALLTGLLWLAPSPSAAYQAGTLKNHAHTSVAGDGGANITPASVVTSTFTCSSCTFSGGVSLSGNITGNVTIPASSTFTVSPSAVSNLEWVWVGSGSVVNVTTVSISLSGYGVNPASRTVAVDYNLYYAGGTSYISGVWNGDKSADTYSTAWARIELGSASGGASGTSSECAQFSTLAVRNGTTVRGRVEFDSPYFGTVNEIAYRGWLTAYDGVQTSLEDYNWYNGRYENPNATLITSFEITGHVGACTSTVTPVAGFNGHWDLYVKGGLR